jgi:hypothetical protein
MTDEQPWVRATIELGGEGSPPITAQCVREFGRRGVGDATLYGELIASTVRAFAELSACPPDLIHALAEAVVMLDPEDETECPLEAAFKKAAMALSEKGTVRA